MRAHWIRTAAAAVVGLACLALEPMLRDWSSVEPGEPLTAQLWARQELSVLVGWMGGTAFGALAALLVFNYWQELQAVEDANQRLTAHSAQNSRAIQQHLQLLQGRLWKIGFGAVDVPEVTRIESPHVGHDSSDEQVLDEWWAAHLRETLLYLAEFESSWAQFQRWTRESLLVLGGPLPRPDPPRAPSVTEVRTHLLRGHAARPKLKAAFEGTRDLVLVLDRLTYDGLPDMLAAHVRLQTALSNWSHMPELDQYEPKYSEEPLNEAELRDYPYLVEFVAGTLRSTLDLHEMTISLSHQYPATPGDARAE